MSTPAAPVDVAVAAVARVGLRSDQAEASPEVEAVHLAPAIRAGVVDRCVEERLATAALWVHPPSEWDDDSAQRLTAASLLEQQTSAVAESVAATLVDELDSAGVRVLVLKGLATAHLDHSTPEFRPTRDIDLLVLDGLAAAVDVAIRLGAVERIPPPRRRWGDRWARARTLSLGGLEIDLHQRLLDGAAGIRQQPAVLGAHRQPLQLAGRNCEALDDVGRLVHASIHLATARRGPVHSARDVAELSAVVALGHAVQRADEWHVSELFAGGVQRSDAMLRRGEQSDSVTVDSERGWLAAAAELPWHQRPGFVLPLVWPERRYMQARGRTRVSHVYGSWRRLRR